MLRDDVLLLLTEAEGYLSGEEMREKLGVSRAAVSQAVRALRADGTELGRGQGARKQRAEEAAAQMAMERLNTK